MRAKYYDLQLQIFNVCFEKFLHSLETTMAKKINRCELGDDFIDDFEDRKQQLLIDELLTKQKP
jgi:hypothetical protein